MAGEKGLPSLLPHEEEEEEVVLVEREEAKERSSSLTPWEQHSSVIILPRYDYAAASSLLRRSHSGFLITCPIKREKSATKEAISLLKEYVNHTCGNVSGNSESFDAKIKKRRVSCQAENRENAGDIERNGNNGIPEASGKAEEVPSSLSCETSGNVQRSLNLSLVKLTRSGLLLFAFPTSNFHLVVDILSNIFLSLSSGRLKSPLWCNRIFPIQETCLLLEKELEVVVSKLFREFLGDGEEKLDKPIRFAVGYNRRGVDETEMKTLKDTEGSKESTLMDRDQCFRVVAGAVKTVAKNSIVDLKSPEVALLVELLPLSGIPHGSSVVGVSVLPAELVSTKPRLCIKSLVANTKMTKRVR
ncbi:uncharacterized protein LOC109707662 [Ananas comosus]|uniref:Uncharacterized protein LOC109707662 n=1 Tax=Ananas comosus TaxID=4615 RepID=A0A199V4Q3_ANACO|nr:uncharacterized protein LOC109707662 [Ananas comosus]OAY71968.1 hypothetical protein ACMD2_10639 [Ananas comosus]